MDRDFDHFVKRQIKKEKSTDRNNLINTQKDHTRKRQAFNNFNNYDCHNIICLSRIINRLLSSS